VITPQLGVNDRLAKIIEWNVKDGMPVKKGEIICSLETTKALYEIDAEHDGVLRCFLPAGIEVEINQPIGVIFNSSESEGKHFEDLRRQFAPSEDSESDIRPTAKAKRIAEEHGIDLRQTGLKGIVREVDVRHYLSVHSKPESPWVDLKFEQGVDIIVIYGSGRGALTVIEAIQSQGDLNVACLIDDDIAQVGEKWGIPVIHSSQFWQTELSSVTLFIAIANAEVKRKVHRRAIERGLILANVVAEKTIISPSVTLGQGNFIKSGAVIETNSKIGSCCIIDNGVVIPHDNIIDDYCHLAPGVALGSSICIGEGAIVGIGAAVSTGVSIGKGSIISVGSAVTRDVPDYSVVEGVPAKIVGQRKQVK
jgi:sugar O-acyltransferase (sialic acid O-acetyltransferase NeuD family)